MAEPERTAADVCQLPQSAVGQAPRASALKGGAIELKGDLINEMGRLGREPPRGRESMYYTDSLYHTPRKVLQVIGSPEQVKAAMEALCRDLGDISIAEVLA